MCPAKPNHLSSAHKAEKQTLPAIELTGDQALTVYPNPSSGRALTLHYVFAAGKTLPVALTDVLGRTVYTDNIAFDQEGFAIIHTYSLSSGVYFIHFQDVDKKQSVKLIIAQN